MGAHHNYNRIITTLIQWKSEFHRVKNAKYEKLKELLQQFDYSYNEERENIPTNKEMSKLLGMPYPKVNKLIFDFYKCIVEDFMDKPLVIENTKQKVHIGVPYEEQNPEFIKKDPYHYFKHSFWIDMELQYIPRIGERIDFDFLELDNIFNRGYVHEIRHTIKGKLHEIAIEVHPYDNEYERWQKLKEEYERKKAWERYERNILKKDAD